jgi:hypothetical protein
VTFGSFLEEHSGPDDELGNVVVNGSDTVIPEGTNEAGESVATIYKDLFWLPGGLNGSDGHSLTLNDVILNGNGPTGPIHANNAEVVLSGSGIGAITSSGSKVGVNGHAAALTLDGSSALDFLIESEGTTPGVNYDQLTSAGAISLGGSALRLFSYQGAHNVCPRPPIGQVYTLLSTTGSLTGTFHNVGSGGTATAECIDTSHGITVKVYSYRISLNTAGATKTITATALPAVPTSYVEEPVPPTIAGAAVQGQTLSEAHGIWSNEPTGFFYQWQRCDAAGNGCSAIGGATGQSYLLTSADVGATVRVAETASNDEGSSTPMISTATAVVQAAGAALPPSPVPGGGTSGGMVITAPIGNPPPISSAQIVALLKAQLIPHGKAATLRSMLKHGGLTLPFTAPEAGTLSVQWFYSAMGAKLARVKPLLIATGRQTFAGAEKGRITIRLTAAGKRLLKHSASVRLTMRDSFTPVGQAPVRYERAMTLRRFA